MILMRWLIFNLISTTFENASKDNEHTLGDGGGGGGGGGQQFGGGCHRETET